MNRLLSAIGPVALLFCSAANAQLSKKPDEDQQRATVEIHLDKHFYRPGEGILLFVILKPKEDGIYVAKNWGEAGENIPGFKISLTSIDGRLAQTCGTGSVADYVADTTTPVQWLASEFIYLPFGRFIGWEAGVSCPTTARGKYLVNAIYEPNNPHTLGVARLAETKGQVITTNVEAKSVEIEIR